SLCRRRRGAIGSRFRKDRREKIEQLFSRYCFGGGTVAARASDKIRSISALSLLPTNCSPMPESPTSSRRATRPRISARVASTSSARKKPSHRPVRTCSACNKKLADRSCNSVAREPSASARAATVQAAATSTAFSYPSGSDILVLLIGLPLSFRPPGNWLFGRFLRVRGQQVQHLADHLH